MSIASVDQSHPLPRDTWQEAQTIAPGSMFNRTVTGGGVECRGGAALFTPEGVGYFAEDERLALAHGIVGSLAKHAGQRDVLRTMGIFMDKVQSRVDAVDRRAILVGLLRHNLMSIVRWAETPEGLSNTDNAALVAMATGERTNQLKQNLPLQVPFPRFLSDLKRTCKLGSMNALAVYGVLAGLVEVPESAIDPHAGKRPLVPTVTAGDVQPTALRLTEAERHLFSQAFSALRPRLYAELRSIFLKITHQSLEDAISETYIRALERPDVFLAMSADDQVRWLGRIGTNIIYDTRKSPHNMRTTLLAPVDFHDLSNPNSDPYTIVSRTETMQELRDALRELSERHLKVVLYCYEHPLGLAQIAQELGMTEGSLRQLRHRIRKNLPSKLAALLLPLRTAKATEGC